LAGCRKELRSISSARFGWKNCPNARRRLGVMWGDAGKIFFWIHKDDLSNRRFNNSWLFLQCG
jgi:hypothetical protein